MFAVIRHIEALPNAKLRIEFADGLVGAIDLRSSVNGTGVFSPLKDESLFKQARIGHRGRTVEWPGDIDLCADSLHQEISSQARKAS